MLDFCCGTDDYDLGRGATDTTKGDAMNTANTITGRTPAGVEWRVYHDRYATIEERDRAIATQKTRLAALWRKRIDSLRGRLVSHEYARSEGWSLFIVVGAGREPYSVRTVRVARYKWDALRECETVEDRFKVAQKTVALFDIYSLSGVGMSRHRAIGRPRWDGKGWY